MKSITTIFLLGLFAISFVVNCGLFSYETKAQVELFDQNNIDTDESVDNILIEKSTPSFTFCIWVNGSNGSNTQPSPYAQHLPCAEIEADIRPPIV